MKNSKPIEEIFDKQLNGNVCTQDTKMPKMPNETSNLLNTIFSIFKPSTQLPSSRDEEPLNLLQKYFDDIHLPIQQLQCFMAHTNKKCQCRTYTPDNKCQLRHQEKTFPPCICPPSAPPPPADCAQCRTGCKDREKRTGPQPKTPTVPKCQCVNELNPTAEYFPLQVRPTKSGLNLAIEISRAKCVEKDRIIEKMIEDIEEKDVDACLNVVRNMVANHSAPDYTMAMLKYTNATLCTCSCPCEEIGEYKPGCACIIDPSPLKIINLQRLTKVSWLVQWKLAHNSAVYCYEIYLNGELIKTVGKETTSEVISVETEESLLQVSIYALTKFGRCYPEAVAIAN